MATVIGAFKATLGIDVSEYTSGILSANATTEIFGQTFANFVVSPVLGGIGLLKDFASAAVSSIGDAASKGETLLQLSRATGVATDELQVYKEALRDAGRDGSVLDAMLLRLGDSLNDARQGAQGAAAAFAQIGLDAEDLDLERGALERVIRGINSLGDANARISVSKELLGRQHGAMFQSMIEEAGGYDALNAKMREQHRIIDRELLVSAGKFDDRMDSIAGAFRGLKESLTFEGIDAFMDALGEGTGPENLARALREELIPAARDFAASVGTIAAAVDRLGANVDKVRAGVGAASAAIGGAMNIALNPDDAINEAVRAHRRMMEAIIPAAVAEGAREAAESTRRAVENEGRRRRTWVAIDESVRRHQR